MPARLRMKPPALEMVGGAEPVAAGAASAAPIMRLAEQAQSTRYSVIGSFEATWK